MATKKLATKTAVKKAVKPTKAVAKATAEVVVKEVKKKFLDKTIEGYKILSAVEQEGYMLVRCSEASYKISKAEYAAL